MGKYYTPPKETGKEYVLATEHFYATTIDRCERLPERWKDYILNPLVETAGEINKLVHQNTRQTIASINKQVNYLFKDVKEYNYG